MKKLLTAILSISVLLSITACGNNTELEQIKKENEELQQQSSVIPSPRPLALRQELLDNLQDEYNNLKTQMPKITSDSMDEATKVMDILKENVKKQAEIIEGINGEEDFDSLKNKLSDLMEKYETHLSSGDKKQAQEVEKQMNIILYGNEQGIKTW